MCLKFSNYEVKILKNLGLFVKRQAHRGSVFPGTIPSTLSDGTFGGSGPTYTDKHMEQLESKIAWHELMNIEYKQSEKKVLIIHY